MTQYRNQLLVFATILVMILIVACSGNSTSPDTSGNNNEDTNEAIYNVKDTVNPSDGGMISPSLDSTYTEDEQIHLMTSANDDYVFIRWGGDLEIEDNPSSLTVDRAYNLTANFELKNYDLAVQTEGKGIVSEVLKQQAKQYEHGTMVELIATPADTGTVNEVIYTKRTVSEIKADPSLAVGHHRYECIVCK